MSSSLSSFVFMILVFLFFNSCFGANDLDENVSSGRLRFVSIDSAKEIAVWAVQEGSQFSLLSRSLNCASCSLNVLIREQGTLVDLETQDSTGKAVVGTVRDTPRTVIQRINTDGTGVIERLDSNLFTNGRVITFVPTTPAYDSILAKLTESGSQFLLEIDSSGDVSSLDSFQGTIYENLIAVDTQRFIAVYPAEFGSPVLISVLLPGANVPDTIAFEPSGGSFEQVAVHSAQGLVLYAFRRADGTLYLQRAQVATSNSAVTLLSFVDTNTYYSAALTLHQNSLTAGWIPCDQATGTCRLILFNIVTSAVIKEITLSPGNVRYLKVHEPSGIFTWVIENQGIEIRSYPVADTPTLEKTIHATGDASAHIVQFEIAPNGMVVFVQSRGASGYSLLSVEIVGGNGPRTLDLGPETDFGPLEIDDTGNFIVYGVNFRSTGYYVRSANVPPPGVFIPGVPDDGGDGGDGDGDGGDGEPTPVQACCQKPKNQVNIFFGWMLEGFFGDECDK